MAVLPGASDASDAPGVSAEAVQPLPRSRADVPAVPARAAPSLTGRVLRHVLLPLAATWLIGTAVALAIANHFTEQAFDRAMLDDAYAVAANVRAGERGVEFLLSPREITTVLFDQTEAVYFAVFRADGSLLAGQPDLRASDPEPGTRYRFSDQRYRGAEVRALALDAPNAGRVVIAQTTRARVAMLGRLFGYSLAPQGVLLALLAAWLWHGIRRDLRPLGDLQDALDRRDAHDLSPVPVARSSRELETLGLAVNALFDRLGHSVRAQREFTGNVAHELRTPLAGIRALADYGLAQTSPAVWREQLRRIVSSEARASHLVDQLLGLALADEGHAGLPREALRLDRLAEQTVMRHLSRADARGVDLGARGIDDPVTVQANAALVEGVLDNLIDNALRYGGRTITVELDGRTLGVVDDGPGIAPEKRQDLMQRWSQGPAGLLLGEGAGLGLAIVGRYAKLLGAELEFAQATPEGGLRVRLVFGADALLPAA